MKKKKQRLNTTQSEQLQLIKLLKQCCGGEIKITMNTNQLVLDFSSMPIYEGMFKKIESYCKKKKLYLSFEKLRIDWI